MEDNEVEKSSVGDEEKLTSVKMKQRFVSYKSIPDVYFSWALSIVAASEGHLFVDLVSEGWAKCLMDKNQADLIGSRFEDAVKTYMDIDDDHVLRIFCDYSLSSDDLIMKIVSQLRKVYPYDDFKRRFFRSMTRQSSASTSPNARNQDQHFLNTPDSPHQIDENLELKPEFFAKRIVLILQDIELLCHRTQMALVEVLSAKNIPLHHYAGSAFGRDSFSIKHKQEVESMWCGSLLVVALSTSLQVPSVSYSPLENAAVFGRGSNYHQISPKLFESFAMRISILMPMYARIDPNGNAKTSPAFQTETEAVGIDTQREKDRFTPCLWLPEELVTDTDETGCEETHSEVHNPQSDSTMTCISKFKPFYLNQKTTEKAYEKIKTMTWSPIMERYLRDVITAIRMSSYIFQGVSPRSYNILKDTINAMVAITQDRRYVTPTDVRDLVIEVLAHRIIQSYHAFPEFESEEAPLPFHVPDPKTLHPVSANCVAIAQIVQYCVPMPR